MFRIHQETISSLSPALNILTKGTMGLPLNLSRIFAYPIISLVESSIKVITPLLVSHTECTISPGSIFRYLCLGAPFEVTIPLHI